MVKCLLYCILNSNFHTMRLVFIQKMIRSDVLCVNKIISRRKKTNINARHSNNSHIISSHDNNYKSSASSPNNWNNCIAGWSNYCVSLSTQKKRIVLSFLMCCLACLPLFRTSAVLHKQIHYSVKNINAGSSSKRGSLT